MCVKANLVFVGVKLFFFFLLLDMFFFVPRIRKEPKERRIRDLRRVELE